MHHLFSSSAGFRTLTVRLRVLPLILLCCFALAGCSDLFKINLSGSSGTTSTYSPEEEAMINTWLQSLAGLTSIRQGQKAAAVWRDASANRVLRERASYLVAARPGKYAEQARQELARVYAGADIHRRTAMEHVYLADLRTADNQTLSVAGKAVPRMQETSFPWSLLLWEAAQRSLLADNAAVLTKLSAPGVFADPGALGIGAAPVLTRPGAGKVALLLPLSGTASSLGKQVQAGAQAAAQQLETAGTKMDLVVIDTNQPDWLARYAALPADCITIGGPLLSAPYSALKTQGFGGRAVFAFLSQLPDPSDEGRIAWRFFTSNEDQIGAVLGFAANDLGIHSFGVLAPEDSYGRRMSALFSTAAARQGFSVRSSSYPLGDVKSWTKLTGQFVQAVNVARGAIPRAKAGFGAVFLPDSWSNMDMLISMLRYHGAYNRVMLGTVLWEQGLKSGHALDAETFGLSVFPGVWNDMSESPAAAAFKRAMNGRNVQPGDWSVLGYDFVRFAAALGLREPVKDSAALNAALAAGRDMEWAGAPVVWDALGLAHRRLLLFQPARQGMIPVNREAFGAYYRKLNKMPGSSRLAPLPNVIPDPQETKTQGTEEMPPSGISDGGNGGESAADPSLPVL